MIVVFVPAMRPERLPALRANILSTIGPDDEVQWGYGDECAEVIEGFGDYGVRTFRDPDNRWGHRVNLLFDLIGKTPWHECIFLGADDLLFHEGWAEAALARMREVDGVVVVNDLHNPRGTAALVSVRYIREQSGCVDTDDVVIYPGYHHNYSDNELFETAQSRGRYAYCAESVVEHLHPAAGKGKDDDVYRLGRSHLDEDTALYHSRRHLWASPRSSAAGTA